MKIWKITHFSKGNAVHCTESCQHAMKLRWCYITCRKFWENTWAWHEKRTLSFHPCRNSHFLYENVILLNYCPDFVYIILGSFLEEKSMSSYYKVIFDTTNGCHLLWWSNFESILFFWWLCSSIALQWKQLHMQCWPSSWFRGTKGFLIIWAEVVWNVLYLSSCCCV